MTLAEIVYSPQQIAARVEELAEDLRIHLCNERPLLISVLKGSVIFLSDLVRALRVDSDVDFMSISSYSGGTGPSGVVRIVKDLEDSLEGRHAVVIEDIVDTGFSLSYLIRSLQARQPKSLKVCALIDKKVSRIADLEVDFAGFVTDEFLIGYGLDFQGRYRNLPYLAAVRDIASLASRPDSLVSLFQQGSGPADK